MKQINLYLYYSLKKLKSQGGNTMKQIKLMNLKLTNFKGIKEFDLVADGTDLKVFGGNATGKTTLFDAFVWLLFDKDSNNNSTNNFDIKTLIDGNPISKIEHVVEALLDVDGKRLSLKKIYKEKWTKKRGSSTEDFTGHTTNYYVNEVPSKKKEYEEAIKELVDENVFKLLTNPSYFNQEFHWKEKRDLLIEIAGDITDEEVISTNKDLAKLLEALNDNSIEDHKKIINAKRRDINKEIERIPIRIDEIHRGIPDLEGLDEEGIKKQVESISTEIEAKKEQIISVKNGSEVIELKKKISGYEMEINNVRSEHEQEQKQELYKLQTRLSEEETNLSLLRGNVKSQMQYKSLIEQSIEGKQEQMNELRDSYKKHQVKYDECSGREFDVSECACPTCEQDLPQEKIDEVIARFNKNKSDELEDVKEEQEEINKKGILLKGKVEELQMDIEPIDKEIEKITEQGKKKESDIELLKEKVKRAQEQVVPVEENKKYVELNNEINDLTNKIKEIEESTESTIVAINTKIVALEEQKKQLQVDLTKFAQVKQSKERTAVLEAEEKALAAEYAELEHQLYLTEEFTRKKVNMLTENINNKFKYARFNLFKENINGGLEEVCETTFEGVPYGSGLNNAARINVGLDIINTLSSHYGVQAPIFVDNAESVTSLIDVESQLISLIVSKQDKILRIESMQDDESEVA